MEWTHVLAIVGANFALIGAVFGGIVAYVIHIDNRSDKKIDSYRQETNTKIDEWRKETKEIIKSIQIEMSDFHARMYSLEEKRK
jgi:vacuolar-type H+-ATPase subunit H